VYFSIFDYPVSSDGQFDVRKCIVISDFLFLKQQKAECKYILADESISSSKINLFFGGIRLKIQTLHEKNGAM